MSVGIGAASLAKAGLGQAKLGASRRAVLVKAGFTRRPDGTEAPAEIQQTVVRSFDSEGRLAAFVLPVASHPAYQGAPLHLHHKQDEWIFITDGEFVAEVGGRRYRLKPGDSLLMPMGVPHRWSHAQTSTRGAIHLYTPAGNIDISWDPSPDDDKPMTLEQRKASFEEYGMTLLGPPLTKEEIDATT
jgi:quercetin dioxygenase-like cupin family protein